MNTLQGKNYGSWKMGRKCTGEGGKAKGCNKRSNISGQHIVARLKVNTGKVIFGKFASRCPLCGTLTNIDEKHIPMSIRKEVLSS